MGYSARYHATSLIAVFLALAVGILIGAEFGGDALTQTRKNLENSLVGNLQDARSHVEDLNGELGNANEFDEKVYPVLTRDRLQGQRIALIAFGNLPGEITSAVEDALGPTGAKLVGVGVVREPVDTSSLSDELSATRFSEVATDPEEMNELGTGVGRQIVIGGTLPEVVRGGLFSHASGEFGPVDSVIVVRDQPEGMGPVQRSTANALETSMVRGMSATGAPTVGTFVAVIPRSIEVSSALAVERCTGPMPSGWLRTTITPSSAPNSPLAWVKSPPRTTSGSVPPITIWRPTPVPSSFICSGSVASSEKRVLASSSAKVVVSTGSRTTPTPTSFAPVGPSASSTAEVMSPGRLPKAIRATRSPSSRSRVSAG